MGRVASRGLTLVLFAAFVAALVMAVATKTQGDGLVRVPSFDYVNDLPDRGLKIVCSHRGSRSDFVKDGSDVVAGDRLVRDCRVEAR